MKAFNKADKKKLQGADRRASADMSETIEKTLYTPSFSNAEMYVEFHREELLPGMVAKMFRDGHIDFFHRDNGYAEPEIIDTVDGKVLVVPTSFYMNDLIVLMDALYEKKAKRKTEAETETE